MKENNKEAVDNQYNSTEKLDIRIAIHKKYSTNKMGFGNWIYSNYSFSNNMNILELGCGTGVMWQDKINELPHDSNLYLTDYSEAMVNKTRALLGERDNVNYEVVNIESIPFEDNKFDRAIANMMLYHVPNIPKALSEVSRVLKDEGIFYCATYGENGIADIVAKMLNIDIESDDKVFTLQNGYQILKPYFSSVERLDYVDSLEVTNIEDLIDYIYSLQGLSSITKIDRAILKDKLEEKMMDGILTIPKEYGMFICKK